MQGGENAIVQSPLKLTPILGSPSASGNSESENQGEIDASCLHLLRKYKRKSSMPLPPNTVIYCSYA